MINFSSSGLPHFKRIRENKVFCLAFQYILKVIEKSKAIYNYKSLSQDDMCSKPSP